MLSTPAASAKDLSVVESTLKKRTPLNDCCMRRKCGSIRRHELQNLAVMKTCVEITPSTRRLLDGVVVDFHTDTYHSVARDAVWRCRHLVHLDVIIIIAAVERFFYFGEGHGA